VVVVLVIGMTGSVVGGVDGWQASQPMQSSLVHIPPPVQKLSHCGSDLAASSLRVPDPAIKVNPRAAPLEFFRPHGCSRGGSRLSADTPDSIGSAVCGGGSAAAEVNAEIAAPAPRGAFVAGAAEGNVETDISRVIAGARTRMTRRSSSPLRSWCHWCGSLARTVGRFIATNWQR
jgi:hypothetical protein